MKFGSITERIKTPRADKLAEKKENEEYGIHGATNLSGLKDAEGISPKGELVEQENQYNFPGSEELIGGQEYPGQLEDNQKMGGKFVNIEDVPDEHEILDNEGDTVSKLDFALQEKIDKELQDMDKNGGSDPYDIRPLITELFANIEKKQQGQKERDREADDLFRRINIFLPAYRAILDSELTEKEEHDVVMKAFKRIIGDIVYFHDAAEDGEIKKELLPQGRIRVQTADAGMARGQKIYYNARGKGYLTQEEANISDKKKNGARGWLGKRTVKPGVQAYNPQTGKKEVI